MREKCKAAYLGEINFDSKDSNTKGLDQLAYPFNPSAEMIGSAEAASMQLARLLTQFLVEKQNSGFVLYNSDSLNSLQNSTINLVFNLKIANLCQNKNNWVIDSGASDHMTWDKNILQIIKTQKNPNM
jgi:hypothetical protein